MKQFKVNISSLLTRICAAGVALLGFNSCANEECMYGTPYGTFEIKGSVTTENGEAVDNASIRFADPNAPSGLYPYDTSSTNNRGDYEIKGHGFYPDLKVVCVPENEALEADSVVVNMDYISKSKKKDPWDSGHAEKIVDFKLKNKENKE